MSKASVGAKYERMCRKIYEQAGYSVIRAAASKGCADLIASNEKRVAFIQVKKTATKVYTVRAGAVRELQQLNAPWGHPVDRLAWIWVQDHGWHVIRALTHDWCDCTEVEFIELGYYPSTRKRDFGGSPR